MNRIDNQRWNGDYVRLNRCADLESKHITAVPSLHLSPAFRKYSDDIVEVSDENIPTENASADVPKSDTDTYKIQLTVDDEFTRGQEKLTPNVYNFSDINVSLHGGEFLYEDNLRFHKQNTSNGPYEGYSTLKLISRSQTPVAFKILSNKPDEATAVPNLGILHCGNEATLKIFLKTWNDDHMKYLMLKMQIAKLGHLSDIATVWHEQNAVINSTPRLRCVLVEDDYVPISLKDFPERGIETTKAGKAKKRRRSGFFGRIFGRVVKAFRQRRRKLKNSKENIVC